MASAAESHRSFRVPGEGADEVTDALLEVLSRHPGLRSRKVAAGRVNVSITGRPRWALVMCIATIWLLGLGLLFLLVRRTSSGEITVTDGPRGAVVTVPPLIDEVLFGTLQAAFSAGRTGPGTTGELRPPPPAAQADPADLTVARLGQVLDRPPPATSSQAHDVSLIFAAGTVVVPPECSLVLGRSPSAIGASLAADVPGDAATVSKSHLVITSAGGRISVEDLYSTNGTRRKRGEQVMQLDPGTPVEVGHGDEVTLGAVTCVVDCGIEHR